MAARQMGLPKKKNLTLISVFKIAYTKSDTVRYECEDGINQALPTYEYVYR